MDVEVQPGVYVIAVSGGVDSVALLNVLAEKPELKLVVAHYDHGIRHDSEIDRKIVQDHARRLGLPFVYHEGKLGYGASEETARKARYEFLHHTRRASGAKAIITAHHHDDTLETAVLNMLRGTNRKGISALKSKRLIHRPALHITKNELQAYAQDQGLAWREDTTNSDTALLRNYIRHKILPRLGANDRAKLAEIISNIRAVNEELDMRLLHFLHVQTKAGLLDRKTFIKLPHSVAREVIAAWLRHNGIRDFDQKALERIVINAKVLTAGKEIDVLNGRIISLTKTHIILK